MKDEELESLLSILGGAGAAQNIKEQQEQMEQQEQIEQQGQEVLLTRRTQHATHKNCSGRVEKAAAETEDLRAA